MKKTFSEYLETIINEGYGGYKDERKDHPVQDFKGKNFTDVYNSITKTTEYKKMIEDGAKDITNSLLKKRGSLKIDTGLLKPDKTKFILYLNHQPWMTKDNKEAFLVRTETPHTFVPKGSKKVYPNKVYQVDKNTKYGVNSAMGRLYHAYKNAKLNPKRFTKEIK